VTLKQWADNGWLREHRSGAKEIAGLLSIVDRDLKDAGRVEVSADWRFGIAYNAALKLCTMLLHASGYRPEKALQHYRTIQALPMILGDRHKDNATYLETCRIKRNTVEYDIAGAVTEKDARELLMFAGRLQSEVLNWLKVNHPELLKP
jgi:hypothetical protein